MATERMYDLAFQYKKTKLWKKLYDSDVFAVKLSDGAIGYCCIMGMAGEMNAVALYVGDKGFQSYRNIAHPSFEIRSEFSYQELLLSQDCLQCAFDNKDALSDGELAEVRAYAKAHGITLRGANAFPQFVKYQPNCYPWNIVTDTDKQRICEALEACLALSEQLKTKHKSELGLQNVILPEQLKTMQEGGLGLPDVFLPTKTLPMLERVDGRYSITHIDIPPEIPIEHPAPKVTNDILAARIKRAKKKDVFECEVIRLPEAVQENEGTVPYYPVILLAVDRDTGLILPPKPVMYFEEHPEELLEAFGEALLECEVCPRVIEASDERTFALLQDLCKKTGIRLSLADDDLLALEEARDSFMSAMFLDDEDYDEPEMATNVFDMLMNLSDSELEKIPKELLSQMLQLADAGLLPPEVEARMRRIKK